MYLSIGATLLITPRCIVKVRLLSLYVSPTLPRQKLVAWRLNYFESTFPETLISWWRDSSLLQLSVHVSVPSVSQCGMRDESTMKNKISGRGIFWPVKHTRISYFNGDKRDYCEFGSKWFGRRIGKEEWNNPTSTLSSIIPYSLYWDCNVSEFDNWKISSNLLVEHKDKLSVDQSTRIARNNQIMGPLYNCCRSQWPHVLRHELSSPARTLGSWVRIPLKAQMFVCVYTGSVILCVDSGLVTCWSPVQGDLPTV
jgi:hypothetical protein